MKEGKIISVIGVVIDVQFAPEDMPKVYDALIIKDKNLEDLVLEVEAIIDENIVRALSMRTTYGVKRGMKVVNTGKQIRVPVGRATLGRILNVLGEPIDNKGKIGLL